jgi:hypothetical protein
VLGDHGGRRPNRQVQHTPPRLCQHMRPGLRVVC